MPTLPEAFREHALTIPDQMALRFKVGHLREDLTYGELLLSIEKVARSLMALGLEQGDRIAILSENRPRWAMLDFGGMLAGAIVVPLHTTFSGHQLMELIEHSESRYLFVSTPELYKKIRDRIGEARSVAKIITFFDPSEEMDPRTMTWAQFIAEQSDKPFPKVDPDDICTLIYSSGTTGTPKGVALSHNNFLFNINAAHDIYGMIGEKDVFLSFLPISHAFERMAGSFFPLIKTGSTVAYVERSKSMKRNLEDIKPTIMVSVPRVFELVHENIVNQVANSGEQKKRIFNWALRQQKGTWNHMLAEMLVFRKIRAGLGGRILASVSGGAPLSNRIANFFSKVGVPLYQGYGMTEASPVISANYPGCHKIGTVGKPLPGITVKIAEDGEILVKGPNVMKGYWNNPEATKEAIDEEGWLHTGDAGSLDEDGYLIISGRKKEMIVTLSGKNVWPEVVEQVLETSKYINQTYVIGDNQKYLSALVVPQWDDIAEWAKANGKPDIAHMSHEEIAKNPDVIALIRNEIKIVCRQLAEYERIVKFTLVPNEFSWEREEITPTLKLRRRVIHDHYQAEISAMSSDNGDKSES